MNMLQRVIAVLFALTVFCSTSFSSAATNDDAIAGTWALRQVISQADMDSSATQNEINNALDTPGVKGFSMRVQWADIDTNFDLLDDGLALAANHNPAKDFAPRFMAGKHCPSRLFDVDNCPYYTDGGQKVPRPFLTDGSPNTIFETEWEELVGNLADWCRTNGVRELHLPWYGQEWAELYHGTPVRNLTGYSYANFVTAHERLIDIALDYAGTDLAVEFPFSGHGPLTDVANDLADYVIAEIGNWNPIFFCQANGWGVDGEWGTSNPDTEAAFDVVWTKAIHRGLQSIQPQDFAWSTLYADSVYTHALPTYVEIYTPSFNDNQAHKADLETEVQDFADLCAYMAPATNFQATAGDAQVQLTWTNPTHADFTGTRIQRSTTGYPTTATSGTNVYDGSGTSTTASGLTNGVMYYFSAFAHDSVPNYSTSVGVAATPEASSTIVTFESQAANDGWILESSETSGKGGSVSATGNVGWAIRVGDEGADMQYKSILSFSTSSLPDSATIIRATLKIKREELGGTNPWSWATYCYADIKTGYFGSGAGLVASDWEAAATHSMVTTMSNPTTDGAWSTGDLGPNGRASVNKLSTNGGLTQLRVYMSTDDNDNGATDCMGFPSGEFATQSSRPILEVEYQ